MAGESKVNAIQHSLASQVHLKSSECFSDPSPLTHSTRCRVAPVPGAVVCWLGFPKGRKHAAALLLATHKIWMAGCCFAVLQLVRGRFDSVLRRQLIHLRARWGSEQRLWFQLLFEPRSRAELSWMSQVHEYATTGVTVFSKALMVVVKAERFESGCAVCPRHTTMWGRAQIRLP